jgi:putative spermidine/putrescine transport system ATP-binding protein
VHGSLVPMASTSSSASDAVKLHAQGICKFYDATAALNPIELKIFTGELLTLLGPSGSGKTTLLQLISGLVKPSSGRLIIDGRDQTDLEPYKRDIGVVFQNYSLFPHLTVQENIAFPLQMRGQSDRVSATQVAGALDMVGLEKFGKRFPHELSGGQQQRVALARCLVYKPSLILMDESLSALDRKLREAMQVEIKRIHRETGSTIVFVTHDQEEALALSDRICLMNDGAIEQLGTPLELYDKPKSIFAATFIGTSNVISGEMVNATQIRSDISDRADRYRRRAQECDSRSSLQCCDPARICPHRRQRGRPPGRHDHRADLCRLRDAHDGRVAAWLGLHGPCSRRRAAWSVGRTRLVSVGVPAYSHPRELACQDAAHLFIRVDHQGTPHEAHHVEPTHAPQGHRPRR